MSNIHDIPGHTTRPRALIDLAAMARNYAKLDAVTGRARIGASVKADAYGLGLSQVSKALYGAGCRTFFVATPGEGKFLRDAVGDNSTIYVLNGPAPQDLGLYFKAKLRPVLNSTYQVGLWAEHAGIAKHAPYSALMVDTGMNRLGVSMEEAKKLAGSAQLQKRIGLDHVMSHLACAPTPKHPKNAEQLAMFGDVAKLFPKATKSLANSAGIFLGEAYHFDMVRPGIALYGGQHTLPRGAGMEPVVVLQGNVLQVRNVLAGETLGYDATFTAPEAMQVATVAAGYADGLPVQLSGTNDRPGGTALIGDGVARIVGRVSMDLTLLDVTGMDVTIGQTASFFGAKIGEAAKRAGTNEYALLTGLGQRVRREIVRTEPHSPDALPPSASAKRPPKGRGRTSRPQKSPRRR